MSTLILIVVLIGLGIILVVARLWIWFEISPNTKDDETIIAMDPILAGVALALLAYGWDANLPIFPEPSLPWWIGIGAEVAILWLLPGMLMFYSCDNHRLDEDRNIRLE